MNTSKISSNRKLIFNTGVCISIGTLLSGILFILVLTSKWEWRTRTLAIFSLGILGFLRSKYWNKAHKILEGLAFSAVIFLGLTMYANENSPEGKARAAKLYEAEKIARTITSVIHESNTETFTFTIVSFSFLNTAGMFGPNVIIAKDPLGTNKIVFAVSPIQRGCTMTDPFTPGSKIKVKAVEIKATPDWQFNENSSTTIYTLDSCVVH